MPAAPGKATLLRCINFLERADSGLMNFGGNEIDLRKTTYTTVFIQDHAGGFLCDLIIFKSRELFAAPFFNIIDMF